MESNPQLMKCACQFCHSQIQFEHGQSGQSVYCPHCNAATTLAVIQEVHVQVAPPPRLRMTVRLASGYDLNVREIRLYDAASVAKLNDIRSDAAKLMGGVSTGLIPIGSLEYAVEAGLAIGLLEGLLSDSAAKTGLNRLREALQYESWLRRDGKFCAIEDIKHIADPTPSRWSKTYQRIDKNETVSSALIHLGDEFVCIRTDDGLIRHIRWSSVDCFTVDTTS